VNITEVRIKLMPSQADGERLQGFCSITLDHSLVIRDLKIIQGAKGLFVAMPSRKLTDRCGGCHTKNELKANFCSHCGGTLAQDRAVKDASGRAKLYADIAHPINQRCREWIQETVLVAFNEELERSLQPGYVCRYDDYGENDFADCTERHILPLIETPATTASAPTQQGAASAS